jgi:hypothetical protein
VHVPLDDIADTRAAGFSDDDLAAVRPGSSARHAAPPATSLVQRAREVGATVVGAAAGRSARGQPESHACRRQGRRYAGWRRRSTRRRSWALRATTMVDRLISTAPTAGGRVMPAEASTPAATGTVIRL